MQNSAKHLQVRAHTEPRAIRITREQAEAISAYLQTRPFVEVCSGVVWLSNALAEEEKAFVAGERERARTQLLAEVRAAEKSDTALGVESESEFERARKRAENGEPPHIPTNGKKP